MPIWPSGPSRASYASVILLSTAMALLPLPTWAQGLGLTPEQMREDLVVLRDTWLPRDKSFDDAERRDFDRVVEAAFSNADAMSAADFALAVQKAAATSGNGHSTAAIGAALRTLPIRAWWFADGLYVVSTDEAHRDLLGARIIKLGELSSEEALVRVTPFISGTGTRVRYLSAAFLTSPDVLRAIGASTDDNVTLAISKDGNTNDITLAPASSRAPGDEGQPTKRVYSILVPDAQDNPNRWPHVLDTIAERSPTYAARTDVEQRWLDPDQRVLYLRSNSINGLGETPLQLKLGEILAKSVVAKHPRAVVIDLRFNNGGDFFNTILFSQALPKLMPRDGRIMVLVGRATFSAALVTAAMLKGASQGNVMLIGEPMGDAGHFWAEGDDVKLPNSGIEVHYSDAFQDYETGCEDPDKCYWPTVAFGPRGISLKPDILIDPTFADYAAGRDPVLEKAIELAR
ncbi:peptidase S41 [Mesorhizobium retamae]|uniref:Peptidase S41 n=1 Tax=Mesorhizobium retamae TaxID=2912854 RepID=A0ABS9QCV6_9HYPH|nr:peptidase S41 [Mesorhizobium sp. IRAMC:0171]MCG7504733.1 peptidase S41 [Mesorhizobium sp. IRAMC:0171]